MATAATSMDSMPEARRHLLAGRQLLQHQQLPQPVQLDLEHNSTAMWLRTIGYDGDQMVRQAYWPVSSHSIRCVQLKLESNLL